MRFISAGKLSLLAAAVALVSSLAGPGAAQGRFEPIIRVGESVVTRYQLDERTRFLGLLRAPGDPRDLAREQLVNETVQLAAADAAGINVTEEEIRRGMDEFASRADLTADEFVAALGQNGVSAGTFRDFIRAGVAWRSYVRETFGEEARDIPRSQIARTLARTGTEGGVRVLLSEILLPAGTPETKVASLARAASLSTISNEEEFTAAARQFSAAPSRNRGGERDWLALTTLPDEVRPGVANLAAGSASRPIDLGDAIAVYFMRDRETVPAGTPSTLAIDYALYFTGGAATDAAGVIASVDTCDDLYGVARGQPEERLVRETVYLPELDPDIAAALDRLDTFETAILDRPSGAAVLMLCARTIDAESTVDFDIIGTRLLNEKLTALATHHLAELRAETFVEDLTN